MKYKKIIQEILGTVLEKQGFTYMPNSSWSYERVKDQVWQSVSVVRERYCKGLLIGLAALYAYALNRGAEGEWGWDEKMHLCSLQHILGTHEIIFPLIDIISAWSNKSTYGLSYEQKIILIFYENMHDAESLPVDTGIEKPQISCL